MSNRQYWDAMRTPPKAALKTIRGGRLSGMTDISPQWRLQIMTETFGPIGFGWKYEIVNQWMERIGDEVCVFSQINLYVYDEKWSEAIPGIGGSRLATMEKNGQYVSDECYKMALTDALSVAMKQLGVGADVYLGYSDSKYVGEKEKPKGLAAEQLQTLEKLIGGRMDVQAKVLAAYKVTKLTELPAKQFENIKKRLEETYPLPTGGKDDLPM